MLDYFNFIIFFITIHSPKPSWYRINSVLPVDTVKNYVSASPFSMQAVFIGDTFSRKRTGLAEVGEKGKSRGGKSIRSFVPRTYIVAR